MIATQRAHIEFRDDVVRKKGDPSALKVEALKTQLAGHVARECGLFYVPAVVQFDEPGGFLDTERIDGLESLALLAQRRDPALPDLCYRAGQALAAIHQRLSLPQEITQPLRLPVSGLKEVDVFIHGDYNGANVSYDRAKDRLVIIDWSVAPCFQSVATTGPRYYDVVWFGIFFYRVQPMRALHWRPNEWLRAAIRGYRDVPGATFDLTEYQNFKRQFDPFLLHDYREQLRSSIGWKRIPHWIRQRVTWHMWQRGTIA